jgi:transcriptional regulator with XRE-family HTH domain
MMRPRSRSPEPVPDTARAGPAPSAATADGAHIGARIKALRRERGWTLQELGRRADVSISALSKIENSVVSASFDTLLKIARGLDASFETLLDETAPGPASRLTTTRAGAGLPFETDRYSYRVMSGEIRQKHMIPLHMEVKARSISDTTEWSTHEGEEFIYILRGPIELNTEFYEPLRLETGDSAYFDSQMRHTFVSLGEGPGEMLSICFSRGLFFPDPIGEEGAPRMVKIGG